jgi:formylglycine-generating enzyme required for sulfatase activity
MKKMCLTPVVLLCFILVLSVAGTVWAEIAFSNSIGMQFVRSPAGTFLMGSPPAEAGRDSDENRHPVTITKEFYLAVTETSQEQFQTIMGYNPSAYKNFGADYPVEQVSWDECQVFIQKLNQKENTQTYRLPTEAEWEYACRTGTDTAFSSGEIKGIGCKLYKALDSVAWYCGNSDFLPHKTGQKKANPWGLFDMHGNVQEWCLDRCERMSIWSRPKGVITDTYIENAIDPLSQKGEMRIFRGGSWNQSSKYARSADRSCFKPVAKRNYLGFRILKEK